jgi:hypothetical protein
MEENLIMSTRKLLSICMPANSCAIEFPSRQFDVVAGVACDYTNYFFLCVSDQLALGKSPRLCLIKAD